MKLHMVSPKDMENAAVLAENRHREASEAERTAHAHALRASETFWAAIESWDAARRVLAELDAQRDGVCGCEQGDERLRQLLGCHGYPDKCGFARIRDRPDG